jgi:hypothetical protein
VEIKMKLYKISQSPPVDSKMGHTNENLKNNIGTLGRISIDSMDPFSSSLRNDFDRNSRL